MKRDSDILNALQLISPKRQARIENAEKNNTKDLIVEIQFDSFAEQVDELMKICESIRQPDRPDYCRWIPGQSGFVPAFVGRDFKSWDDVRVAAFSEWKEGLDALDNMMERLQHCKLPRPQNLRRQRVFREDQGDELNLDRLQRGLPYWQTTQRQHRPGPLSVTIVVDVGASRLVAPSSILWKGAAAICLTELLESAGYRVELWGGHYSLYAYEDGRAQCMSTCLKRASDPIDKSTLVNAVSGWSFRTIFFGSYFHGGRADKDMGCCISMDSMLKYITPDEKAVLCEDVYSIDAAVDWVQNQLSKFDLQGVQQ